MDDQRRMNMHQDKLRNVKSTLSQSNLSGTRKTPKNAGSLNILAQSSSNGMIQSNQQHQWTGNVYSALQNTGQYVDPYANYPVQNQVSNIMKQNAINLQKISPNQQQKLLNSNSSNLMIIQGQNAQMHQNHILSHLKHDPLTIDETESNESVDIFHKPVFKLLKGFKLQQYAMKMTEMGYGEDIYKLALLSQRQREDLIDKLHALPGHKSKLLEMFRVIDHLFPKNTVVKTIENAIKGAQSDNSANLSGEIKLMMNAKQSQNIVTAKSQSRQGTRNKNLSPVEKNKNGHVLSFQYDENVLQRNRSNSKKASDTFLFNVKARRNQITVQDLLKGYQQSSADKKERQKAISKIFPVSKFGLQKWTKNIGHKPQQKSEPVKEQVVQNTMDQIYQKYKGMSNKSLYERSQHIDQIGKIVDSTKNINSSGQKGFPNITKQKVGSQTRQNLKDSNLIIPQVSSTKIINQNQNALLTNQAYFQIQYETPDRIGKPPQQRIKSAVSKQGQKRNSQEKKIETKNSFENAQDLLKKKQATERQKRLGSRHKSGSREKYKPQKSGDDIKVSSVEKLPQIFKKSGSANKSIDYNNSRPTSQRIESLNQSKLFNNTKKVQENPESSTISVKDDMSKNYYSESTQNTNPFKIKDFDPSDIHISIAEQPVYAVQQQQFRYIKPQDWTPLINQSDKSEAQNYGYSFGSKKVNMSPAFLDLRVMCKCLAKAISKHLQFSKGSYLFLEDLQQAQQSNNFEFSYKFNKNLKLGIGQSSRSQINSLIDPHQTNLERFKEIDQNLRNQIPATVTQEDIEEDLDRDEDDEYDAQEEQHIENIREEVFRKSIIQKEEDRLAEYLKKRQQLEQRLKVKEDRIKQLSNVIQLYDNSGDNIQEVLAISSSGDDDEPFKPMKMTKQEFIMAQVDLDIIESHGSQEMSTHKFKLQNMKNPIPNHTQEINLHGTDYSRDMNMNNSQRISSLQDSGKPPKPNQSTRRHLDSQASYESQYQIQSLSKDKIKEFLAESMKIFSEKFDFENDLYDEDIFVEYPTEEEIFEYCKYVTSSSKMENEIPIICLVYLERFITKTGILLTTENWKRLTLISLCVGSKIWDDDSLENVHFPKVMGDVSLKMINQLERQLMEFMNYELVVKGSEYAKYYFILRTLADEIQQETPLLNKAKAGNLGEVLQQEWNEFPLKAPITVERMQELQTNSAKAEIILKERHEKEQQLRGYSYPFDKTL